MKKFLAFLGAFVVALACVLLPNKVEQVSANSFSNSSFIYTTSYSWTRFNSSDNYSYNGFWVTASGNLVYSSYTGSSTYHYLIDLTSGSRSNTGWTGNLQFMGYMCWTDSFTNYVSNGSSKQYYYNGSSWVNKTWLNPNFTAQDVTHIDEDIYLSTSDNKNYNIPIGEDYMVQVQFYLKDVNGDSVASFVDCSNIWTDGVHYFYEDASTNIVYVYDGDLTFKFIGASSLISLNIQPYNIFSDGYYAYCLLGTTTYYRYDFTSNSWLVTNIFHNQNVTSYYPVTGVNSVITWESYLVSRSTTSTSYLIFNPIRSYGNGIDTGYDIGYNDGYSAGYNAGLNSSSDSSYSDGYSAGYQQALADRVGYNTGYNDGYNIGYNAGVNAGSQTSYNDGYSAGNTTGYANGYNDGLNDANQYSFYNLFGAVLDAPISALTGLLDFTLLGVNLLSVFTGLLSVVLLVFVIKIIVGGK